MALIEKRRRADGKFSYRVRVKFRDRVLSSTHGDRLTAERWAAEQGSRIRDDAHFADEGNRRRLMSELVDRYVDRVLPQKRNARSQRPHLAWWRQRIGHLNVHKVTRAVIAECRDELLGPRKGKKTLAPATVVRFLSTLSHLFSVAQSDWEWCSSNPVRGVRKPKEPTGREWYLQPGESQVLLDACRASTSEALYPAVVIALSTGMRRGEILGLEWRDVDLVRRQISLRQTKNGSRRTIPLCSPAFELLQTRREQAGRDAVLVFPADPNPDKPDAPAKPKDIAKAWETARAKAGLKDFRFHDLRHSAASFMAMSGASTLEIAAILGHRTLQMTKRYSHLSNAHLRVVMERAITPEMFEALAEKETSDV